MRSRSGTAETLRPFRGRFIPGLYASTGHCLWVYRWAETPTAIGSYSGLFLIEPDGTRTCYTDPDAATSVVETYHEFDHTHGATFDWDHCDDDGLAVIITGDDSTHVDLELTFTRTWSTRLLDALSALTPRLLLTSPIGQWLADWTFHRVGNTTDGSFFGTTERGTPFRIESERHAIVDTATCTLDDTPMELLAEPDDCITFGDAIAPPVPLALHGAFYLPPPADGDTGEDRAAITDE